MEQTFPQSVHFWSADDVGSSHQNGVLPPRHPTTTTTTTTKKKDGKKTKVCNYPVFITVISLSPKTRPSSSLPRLPWRPQIIVVWNGCGRTDFKSAHFGGGEIPLLTIFFSDLQLLNDYGMKTNSIWHWKKNNIGTSPSKKQGALSSSSKSFILPTAASPQKGGECLSGKRSWGNILLFLLLPRQGKNRGDHASHCCLLFLPVSGVPSNSAIISIFSRE